MKILTIIFASTIIFAQAKLETRVYKVNNVKSGQFLNLLDITTPQLPKLDYYLIEIIQIDGVKLESGHLEVQLTKGPVSIKSFYSVEDDITYFQNNSSFTSNKNIFTDVEDIYIWNSPDVGNYNLSLAITADYSEHDEQSVQNENLFQTQNQNYNSLFETETNNKSSNYKIKNSSTLKSELNVNVKSNNPKPFSRNSSLQIKTGNQQVLLTNGKSNFSINDSFTRQKFYSFKNNAINGTIDIKNIKTLTVYPYSGSFNTGKLFMGLGSFLGLINSGFSGAFGYGFTGFLLGSIIDKGAGKTININNCNDNSNCTEWILVYK